MNNLFCNGYPYTDFHELNLSWVVKKIVELNTRLTEFVSLNTIKYADPIQWNITSQYGTNTVVIDPVSGVAYISVKPVPMGVSLSDTDYWTEIFDLGQIMGNINKNLTVHNDGYSTTSTFDLVTGDWVLWNGVLYEAMHDIDIGDAYVPDANIKQRSVEELIVSYVDGLKIMIDHVEDLVASEVTARADADDVLRALIEAEADARADADDALRVELSDLITSKVGIEAQAREDADDALRVELSDLITSKVNIEAQIRAEEDTRIYTELNELIPSIYDISKHGAIADGVTDNTAIIQAGIDSGMAVYIPKGVWATNQLELKYGTKIFGRSDGYAGNNGSTLKALHNTGSVIHVNTGIHKVIIKDIGIDGSGVNITCPNGIEINHDVSDYLIERVYVKRARIGIYLGSTGWATVRDCFVENCYSDGFKMENNMDSRPLQINFINCLAEKNDGNGYRFINNQDSVAPAGTMINCATFANSGRGVIYYGGFSAIRMNNCFFGSDGNTELELNGNNGEFPATIVNCQFELAGLETTGVDKATAASHVGYGLVLTAGSSANIDNVLITSNSGAGVVLSDSRSSISNSFIGNNTQFLGGTELLTDQPSRLLMSNNTIKSNKAYGLYFSNATDVACIVGNLYANYTNSANYIAAGNTTVHVINNVDKNGQMLT